MKLILALTACLVFSLSAVKGQADIPRLTNIEIVEMAQAGISSEIIIAKIKVSRCNFDTTPSVLAELKHKGIPNEVLLAMVEAPYGPPRIDSVQRNSVPSNVPSEASPPKRTVAVSGVRFPPRGEYQHKKSIEATYDRFNDRTTVRLKYLNLGPLETLRVVAVFSYSGSKFVQPESITLAFLSSSRSWRFLRDRDLIIIADGNRIDLGETIRADSDVYRGGVSEALGVSVPLETFLTIVNANTVDGRLGSFEFTLAEDHIQALRDFASRMQQ